jgi:hypothetical protein
VGIKVGVYYGDLLEKIFFNNSFYFDLGEYSEGASWRCSEYFFWLGSVN